jgi:exonuclease III
VRIATINIQAGYGTVESNLHVVAKDSQDKGLDLILCTETWIVSKRHARHSGGYTIFATETSHNQGGVALFIRARHVEEPELGWSVEDPEIYDTNMLAVTLVTGQMRRRLIGVYFLTTDISDVTWAGLQKACDEVVDPIWMLGDFNTNLHDANVVWANSATGTAAGSTRQQEIQAFISTLGISNYGRTKLHRTRQGTWTWHLWCNVQGAEQHVKSVCDYILGPRLDPVVKYCIRAIRWIQTDHQMVYIDLLIQRQQHMTYIHGRKRFPKRIEPMLPIDLEYNNLVKQQRKPKLEGGPARPTWILSRTWTLMRKRQAWRQIPGTEARKKHAAMKQQLKQLLRKDRQQSFDNEAILIEAAMGSNSSAKAGFQLLQKWYKRHCGVSLPMSW